MATIYDLLKVMIEKGASDPHITTGSPPRLRVDGKLIPLDHPPLTPVETKSLCYSILSIARIDDAVDALLEHEVLRELARLEVEQAGHDVDVELHGYIIRAVCVELNLVQLHKIAGAARENVARVQIRAVLRPDPIREIEVLQNEGFKRSGNLKSQLKECSNLGCVDAIYGCRSIGKVEFARSVVASIFVERYGTNSTASFRMDLKIKRVFTRKWVAACSDRSAKNDRDSS